MKNKVKEEKLNSVLKKLYNVKGFYYGAVDPGNVVYGAAGLGEDITPVVGCIPSREENRCGGYGTIAHCGLQCDFGQVQYCPGGSARNSWIDRNDPWQGIKPGGERNNC